MNLSTLLGIEQTGGANPQLATISAALSHGKIETFAVEAWGGLPRRLLARHAARFANPDCDGQNDLDYDFSSIAEIFSSTTGRRIAGAVTLLGRSESEDQQGDEVDLWVASGWWEVLAIESDWQLLRHSAHGGALYRLEYTDSGFTLSYWFFVEQ